MRWLKASVVVAAILLTAGVAAAQTIAGTITGHVVDMQGLVVPGVTITVEGPNLQGSAVVVSSENGDYIIPQLPSGTYKVTFQLTGFERQEKTVSLAPTQTLPLNVTMGPAAISETVNVIASTGNVLTQTAQVATNFNQDLIAMLPTNRSIDSVILRAPAVHPTGPNASYSIAGAMSFESLFLVNGVAVNENLRGQPLNVYIEEAIQETTVATSGISAEYGRFSGGVVNVITKSGGNLFAGAFRETAYNDNWRALVTGNDTHPFPPAGTTVLADSKVAKSIWQTEAVFGGPIIKNQLTFFLAGRLRNDPVSRNTVAPLNLPYVAENRSKRFETKVTYSANSNHRFEGSYAKESLDQLNNTFQTSSSMDYASLYDRKQPTDLFTINYKGILSPRLFVEGRFTQRTLSFIGSGSQFTDLIKGTLLIDRNRGSLRWWSATFCGVCDPEKRDNDEEYVKGTYFLSTKSGGAHNMVFGYDLFNDKKFANNHQSGSDYRIIGTSSIVRGTDIYPMWNPGTSTVLQYNPILVGTLGTNFRTHSIFYNDNWHYNTRLTFNLGVRWDKNHGVNGAGDLIVKDSALSPRVGVIWDPKGDGVWSVTASAGRYVAAIANGVADGSSAGGQPAAFQWQYQGPAINPDPNAPTESLVSPAAGIQQVFNWCNADSTGMCRQPIVASSIPGVSLKVSDGIMSPNVVEYATGISRQFGSRAVVRADYAYRDYRDFYAGQIDLSTGTVVDPFGNRADLEIDQNTNRLKRRYSGVTLSTTYRVGGRTDVGGNYTLSRLSGNWNGENATSAALVSGVIAWPEYHQDSWFIPEGDLEADQRHRASMWLNYGVPKVTGLTLSVLQDLASGTPFGANGSVDARPYVAASIASQYATPQGGSSEMYWFTARDAFHTEAIRRTDFAANYNYGFNTGGHKLEAFFQAQVLNVFNTQDMCGCGGDVFQNGGGTQLNRIGQSTLSNVNSAALVRFNPFTETPVQGTNWNYASNFNTPLNRFAFTSPRTFRMTFGLRF
jgi:hypothetical protein